MSPRSTSGWTPTPTSCPASATPATGCSARRWIDSGGYVDVFDMAHRRRHGQAILAQAIEMEGDRIAHVRLGLLHRPPGGHAARKIRRIDGKTDSGPLDDDGITHGDHLLRPACFRILLHVPAAKSSAGLPATVTRPGLEGCLYWR